MRRPVVGAILRDRPGLEGRIFRVNTEVDPYEQPVFAWPPLFVLRELALVGDCQRVSSLEPSRGEHAAPALGRHPGPEAKAAQSGNALRLIGSLGGHADTPQWLFGNQNCGSHAESRCATVVVVRHSATGHARQEIIAIPACARQLLLGGRHRWARPTITRRRERAARRQTTSLPEHLRR